MAAPTFTQVEAYDSVAVSTTPAIVPGATGSFTLAVSANATIAVVLHQTTANVRSYTVEHDASGSWVAMTAGPQAINSNRKCYSYYATGLPSGTVQIRITTALGTDTVLVRCFELSECSYAAAQASRVGSSGDVGATFGYPTATDAASLDTEADFALISAITLTATGGGLSASSGWTDGAGNGTTYFSQTRTGTTPLTDEQGYVAEAGTNRDYAAIILHFHVPSAGGSAVVGKGLTQSNRLSRMRLAA